MTTKESLINEIETIPETLLNEVLEFVQFLQMKASGEELRAATSEHARKHRKWSELKGSVSGTICGEDAQQWVSRSRQESDEGRKI